MVFDISILNAISYLNGFVEFSLIPECKGISTPIFEISQQRLNTKLQHNTKVC